MSTVTDDVARLAAIMVRQHQRDGLARALRLAAFGATRDGRGLVAKACGTTPDVVDGWETGALKPTTQQGLAWLTFLWDSQPSRHWSSDG